MWWAVTLLVRAWKSRATTSIGFWNANDADDADDADDAGADNSDNADDDAGPHPKRRASTSDEIDDERSNKRRRASAVRGLVFALRWGGSKRRSSIIVMLLLGRMSGTYKFYSAEWVIDRNCDVLPIDLLLS